MRATAKAHGGECLSTTYVNRRTKLKWRCAEGHEWEALAGNVHNAGHWCATCAGRPNLTLKHMQDAAQERGGQCLSTEYVNYTTELLWQCAEGHQWKGLPTSVRSGYWCRKCAINKRSNSIDEMYELAEARGGACLSTTYVNTHTKLRWRCKEGHEWEGRPHDVKAGHWCARCAGRARTLEDLQAVAESRGGRCLSTTYRSGAHVKFLWQCAEGHEWKAAAPSVAYGSWCPVCSTGSSERIIQNIFEQMFGKPFPKKKPTWLINRRGNRMELDGYCRELKLAFEYNGLQHYKQNSFFHQKGHTLSQQKADDARKKRLCGDKGVCVIVVPYTVSMQEAPAYIFKHLTPSLSAAVVSQPAAIKVADHVLPERLRELQALAESRGGRCLATRYIHSMMKVRWQCAKGHEWEASPSNVKNAGQWCPACAGKKRHTIEEMQVLAESRGGKCLSTSYVNVKTKLRWQCALGHEWKAPAENVLHSKSWCPTCWETRRGTSLLLNIEEMQATAKERGGKCLSTSYVHSKTKLRWQCAEGHEWEAVPNSVKSGSWCPTCARTNRKKRNRKK